MPIRGLTDKKSRSVSRGVVTFGKLRKGAPKPKNGKAPGKDLNYFRVDFEPQYLHLNQVWDSIFDQHPAFNDMETDHPREFDALLIGKTVDDVFSTWNEAWTATKLMHRCDGEIQHVSWNEKTNGYNRGQIPCAGGTHEKYECSGLCSRIGRLSITIPQFNDAIGEFGKFVIATHSFYDIVKITDQLALLESALNTLMFVPVTVGRVVEEKTRPDNANGRAKASFSLLYLKVKTASIQTYIDQQSNPQLVASSPALPAKVDEFNGGTPQLPEPTGLDIEAMTDWLAPALAGITTVDVIHTFNQHGFDYESADKGLRLYAIALVIDGWFVELNDIEGALETLFPRDTEARHYIMQLILNESQVNQ